MSTRNPSLPGTFSLFFLASLLVGNFLVRIPSIKENIGANNAELAIGLLGMPLGTVVVLSFAGLIARRLGVRRILIIGLPLNMVGLVSVGFSTSVTMLFSIGAVTGIALALAEVGINLSASNAEKRLGRLIMNRAHGFWTFGLLCGSGAAALLASFEFSVVAAGATIALVTIPASIYCVHNFACEPPEQPVDSEPHGPFRLALPLVVLGGFLFTSALIEGAAAEWSALYLHELLEWSEAAAGWGVILLAGSLTAIRWSGDWIATRLGPLLMARILGLIGLIGLVLVALPLPAMVALVGFVLIGIGVGPGFPLAMSAGGRLRGDSSMNIAFLSFMSIAAFLAGPPLMGFVAEAFDLRFSYAALIPVILLTLICTTALHKRHAYHQ